MVRKGENMSGKQLRTRWADQIDRKHVHEEYPRPLLVRESYVNLNGVWNYAITRREGRPQKYDGNILVPFSPEAPLSGVNRQLKPQETLWYRRMLPEKVRPKNGERWILHFGAVDQYAAVYLNGRLVKRHLGGYLPFSADVTDTLKEAENELIVRVRDYSDAFYYSRGKQKLKRGGMFYTAQSGIWQTVWMEQVPKEYIADLIVTPLYDKSAVSVRAEMASDRRDKELAGIRGTRPGDGEKCGVAVTLSSEEMQPLQAEGLAGEEIVIPIRDLHSWSPEDPFLYDIEVQAGEDRVRSYTAMRKISVEKDEKGIPRLYLNGRPYFQKGVLDQGYWPEGLYTPPCDEAMVYDIQTMKGLGFNMLRKHIKIEPQRWYYHCDRLGMLVWQDMVNGGRDYRSWYVTYAATAMEYFHLRVRDGWLWLLGRRDERGRKQFVSEMRETVHILRNHPSIVTWVLFNEGWGQFHANTMTRIVREEDGSRLIDQASGGDIRSIHDYFFPLRISYGTEPDLVDSKKCKGQNTRMNAGYRQEERAAALTEFGGYSMSVPGHHMYRRIYGYRIYRKKSELTGGYREWIEREVIPNIEKGLSASVYTQLSDVEEETNGILTYDREIVKLEEETVRELNERMKL